jgi:hypothetical protein
MAFRASPSHFRCMRVQWCRAAKRKRKALSYSIRIVASGFTRGLCNSASGPGKHLNAISACANGQFKLIQLLFDFASIGIRCCPRATQKSLAFWYSPPFIALPDDHAHAPVSSSMKVSGPIGIGPELAQPIRTSTTLLLSTYPINCFI